MYLQTMCNRLWVVKAIVWSYNMTFVSKIIPIKRTYTCVHTHTIANVHSSKPFIKCWLFIYKISISSMNVWSKSSWMKKCLSTSMYVLWLICITLHSETLDQNLSYNGLIFDFKRSTTIIRAQKLIVETKSNIQLKRSSYYSSRNK